MRSELQEIKIYKCLVCDAHVTLWRGQGQYAVRKKGLKFKIRKFDCI